MLRSSLFDYSDAYILVSETITIPRARDNDASKRLDEGNAGITFKNCAPLTDCIN